MTMQIPGYDRPAVTFEDVQEYRKEAERRGHVYQLFVDGDDKLYSNPEEGTLFQAESDEEAMQFAYQWARNSSCKLDGSDIINGLHYPTHGYKLFHRGRLVADYVPPNPEDVASGRVIMPDSWDVKFGKASLPKAHE